MRHFPAPSVVIRPETPVSLQAAYQAGQPLKGVRVAPQNGLEALAARGTEGLRRIALPQDAAGLQRFVRDWTRRHQKKLAAGLPTTLLVLAMGSAAAQAQDAMVDVAGLADVASVEVLADGTARVTLTDGTVLIVPEGSFAIAADGTVMVSAATADSIMAAVAGTDAGGGGEYALAGAGLALAAGAAAGGGGGSGGGTPSAAGGGTPSSAGGGTSGGDIGAGGGTVGVVPPAPEPTASGRVVDGYIANATVFRDLNANNILDAGEPSVQSDATGGFSGLGGTGGVLIATGGIDISTGEPFTGQLTAPSDATVITPLTTLAQALITQSGGTLTAAQAGEQVAQAFGLQDFDVNTTDPVATDNIQALKAGAQIAAIISVAAASAGTAEDADAAASTAVAQALAQAITDAEGDTLLLDTVTLTNALQAALGETGNTEAQVAALQTVIGALEQAEDLAAIETVQTVIQGFLVDAVTSGEELPDSNAIDVAIAQAVPLRPTLNSLKLSDINQESAEEFQVSLSGTGRDGSTITVQFGDLIIATGVTVQDGIWEYTLTQLPADGTATLFVTATADVDGTLVTSLPSDYQWTVTIDRVAPDAPVAALAEDTGADDAITANGTITVTGLEDGAVAEYSLDGGETWTAFEGDSFVIEGDDEYSVTLRQTDAVGNTSDTSEPLVFTLDTTPPMAPTIDPVSEDDSLSADEITTTVTGTAEAGSQVRVTFDTAEVTATADETGAYSAVIAVPTTAGDAQISVVAVDGAGNEGVPALRNVTVEPPAVDLIASALTLDEMKAALTAFAAEQDGLTIPDDLLDALAGDALIYRSGTYQVNFSATVLANEDGAEIENGTVFEGSYNFELPLAESFDQVGNAPNPEAVFQFQQNGIPASSFMGFELDNLRTMQPSLRMDVETFEVGEDADFIRALVGDEGLDALIEAGTITSLQIWLSNVNTGEQSGETGEFSGLNGEEVSLNYFLPGTVGLEAFLDQLGTNLFRQVQIVRYTNGNDNSLATAKIDTVEVTFTPGEGYVAADLVDGFNNLIALRVAVNTAIEKANDGMLSVGDLQAIGNAFMTGDIPFAPPFLAGETISQADINRLEAFLGMPEGEQNQIVAAFNGGTAEIANLTDLLDAPGLLGDLTGGGVVTEPSIVAFIKDDNGVAQSDKILLNEKVVDLDAIVREVIGQDVPMLALEILNTTQAPGLSLNNGNVVIKLSVSGIETSPLNEDWLLILKPDGSAHATVRGGLGESGQLLNFTEVVGNEEGIVFTVINAAIQNGVVVQPDDTYFSAYQLTLNDLADIPAGNLTVAELIPEGQELVSVGESDPIGLLQDGQIVLPSAIGIFPEGGNPNPYLLIGIGDVTIGDQGGNFDVARSVFVDRNGEFTILPGAVTDVQEQDFGGGAPGYIFTVLIETMLDGNPIIQNTRFLYNPVDDEIVTVQTLGTEGADTIIGLGAGDVIIPLGAPSGVDNEDRIFLPLGEDAGIETIVIRPAEAFAEARIKVSGFDPFEDRIALSGTELEQQSFSVTTLELASFASFDAPMVDPGQLQLFAVSVTDGSITRLLAVDGDEEVAELAEFNGVNSSAFNDFSVSLFNQNDILQSLPE